MDPMMLGSLISGLGSIFGGISGGKQQSNLMNSFNQIFGAESGGVGQLLNSYMGQGGGGSILQSLLPGLAGQVQGNEAGVQGAANQLMNWKGLQPGELGALQTSTLNQNNNLMNTFKQQEGGTANPNALIANMAQGGQQNALNLGTQLGSMAEQQELGAREAGGSLLQGLLGQNLGSLLQGTGQQGSLVGSGLQDLGGMGGDLMSMLGAGGNPYGNMMQQLGGNSILQGIQVGGNKGGGTQSASPFQYGSTPWAPGSAPWAPPTFGGGGVI